MKRRWIALLLVCGAVGAQEKPRVQLSLKKTLEIALAPDGNARVQLAAQMVEQAKAQQMQARSALLPNFDGTASWRDFTANLQTFGILLRSPVPGFSLPVFVGPVGVVDARVSGGQSLLDLSAIRRYQASGALRKAAELDQQNSREQAAAQVARAYAAAVFAGGAVETARANVALAEQVLRLAKEQKEAGTGTGIDVTRAEAQAARERQRLIASAEQLEIARLQLLRAMNAGLDVDIELTDGLEATKVEPPALDDALAQARARRPDLKAQTERERGAKLSYQSVVYERIPSLALTGDYGVTGATGDTMLPTRSVAIGLKVPLFDGGRRDARRVESAAQFRMETIRTREVSQQAELEVRKAISALRSAAAQIDAANESLLLSEGELDQAKRRFEGGVATGLEITDAQARLARARESRLDASYAHRFAAIDLALATGRAQESGN